MKSLLIIFSAFVSCSIYGQNAKLWRISLETSTSIIANSTVSIDIINTDTEKEDAPIKLNVTQYSGDEEKEITTEFILQKDKYDEICKNILNINPNNLLSDGRIVVDGRTINLKFMSDTWQQVEYYTYGFDFDEKTTSSKEFLYVVKSILKCANVEIYGINKFKETAKN
jgi:hypothetical protein